MGGINESEGLNLPKCTLTEFFDDVEGKLSLLTGRVNYEEFGLTLEEVRRPMLVIGRPGIGKTCGIISAIKKLNKDLPQDRQLGFKKILLGQTVVGSLSGIPVVRPDGSVVRIQIPDLPNPEKDGEYGVLFLDEITTADEMQIQPALGLADDSRSLGEYTLPEHWIVIGAGNGPDCTNFVRLDDMTISRFSCYDVQYSFKDDFRPYAHSQDLSEDILAFLSFDPTVCVRVESQEMDSAGKLFPCPRTWERLSLELKMRQVIGRPVDYDSIENFAGRIIGQKAGREFAAFMEFKKKLSYDIDKILEGNERDPEVGMAKETFHIIAQALIKKSNAFVKENTVSPGQYNDNVYPLVSNMLNWILKFDELDNKINFIAELISDMPDFSSMMFSSELCNMCPAFDQFFADNAQLLIMNSKAIKNGGV